MGQGAQLFADGLTAFAAQVADPGLAAVADRIAAPVRVAVSGRRGVGRRTVAHALIGAGIEVAGQPEGRLETAYPEADLNVYVIAEVVKPEDRDAIDAAGRPVLAVLNKADLTGWSADGVPGGPLAAARRRCAHFSALTGVPTEPMVAVLAAAAGDGLPDAAMWTALQALAAAVAGPAADGTGDGAPGHDSVPAEVWRRLRDSLDLFGIAHAVAALRQGRSAGETRVVLRRVSCLDAVVDWLAAAGQRVRYRRVLDAVAELETRAVTDRRIHDFLCCDDTVIARMAAAVDVVESAGLDVGACHDRAACLRRAQRWWRYGRESGSDAVQRACGGDIARGSLRLWSRAGASG